MTTVLIGANGQLGSDKIDGLHAYRSIYMPSAGYAEAFLRWQP
jgi:hypothetical protein